MFASQIDPVSFNFLQNSKQEKKKKMAVRHSQSK